nr:hypothetical protein [Streptomyces sp.]
MAAVVRGGHGEARVGGALGGGRRSRIRYHQGPRPQGRGPRAFAGAPVRAAMRRAHHDVRGAAVPRGRSRCVHDEFAARLFEVFPCAVQGARRGDLGPTFDRRALTAPCRAAGIRFSQPSSRSTVMPAYAVPAGHRKRRDSNARTATAAVGGTRTTTGSCSATVVRSSRRGRSGWGSWSTSSAEVPATSLRPRARPTRSARSRRPTLTSTTRPLPRTTTTSTASRRSPCRPGPSGPGSASRGSASST